MNKKKTKSELLSEFKRANKDRREKLAIREGYSTSAEYLAYLKGKKTTTKKNTTKIKLPTIHNVFILDASGSMSGGKIKNAIEGINNEISELKKSKEAIFYQTIVDFSYAYDIRMPIINQPISEVEQYSSISRGATALNDAIGKTLNLIKSTNKPNVKVLVKIFTDGGENDSKEFSYDKIKSLIKECEGIGFTITFVGTEYDTNAAINNYGIHASNTLVHDNTAIGMKMSMDMSTMSTRSYAIKVSKGEDVLTGFYKQEETL